MMKLELKEVWKDPKALFQPKRPEPSYPDLPVVGEDQQSTVPGLYLIGEVAGIPLVKLGANAGYDIVEQLAPDLGGAPEGTYDLIIVGCGASGFSAMVRAHELGLKALCLEGERFLTTFQNMTKGKVLYAEPHGVAMRGSVWFEECEKEELIRRWAEQRDALGLNIQCHEKVVDIKPSEGLLEVMTDKGAYRGAKVVLAIGKAGNPRKAGVPGEKESAERIYHFLSDADKHQDQDVFVYGGGDVALEATIALAGHNRVVMATIDEALVYPKKRNIDKLMALVDAGKVDLRLATSLKEITPAGVVLSDGTEPKADVVFEMIGAVLPLSFFKKVGVRMQSAWTLGTKLSLGALMSAVYMLYAIKSSSLVFPFTLQARDGGLLSWIYSPGSGGKSEWQSAITGSLDGITHSMGLLGHNAWYALLYTVVVAIFGIRAAQRWGKNDPHQRWRFASIIFFQVFFFLFIEGFLAWFLGLWGEEWGKHYWRGWGLAQPFPLFYNTFFWWYEGDPLWLKWGFIGSGLGLTFVGIPLFVRWQGMRFCTWICGCGGLAETLGDTWRHKSPKGKRSRLWEFQATLILVWAFGSAAVIGLFFQTHGDNAVWSSYAYVVDFWLVAVLPIGFYPFFGGKIWCRYWCPLANYMKLLSGWFGRLRIVSNDKCITCTQCSLYCQVGVDVMHYAKNQIPFDNTNTSCIHCGICITVCPVDVLSFDNKGQLKLDEDSAAAAK